MFRGFYEDTGALKFITDRRSQKIPEIAADSGALELEFRGILLYMKNQIWSELGPSHTKRSCSGVEVGVLSESSSELL